ncbi:DUF4253 domain-containing protein [Actinomadura rupiterrae]|uniref:DUF4253 domain-containing protein n=1 Tax=Actinomadura rupiterrae TaxID=559627 RepID=UPI0020A56FD6|nr:DUF4253 domain-containing protein [Actinomadura rupiterrae]MCP2339848.1 hypothetical protein [Actinomadura rupiterrae]
MENAPFASLPDDLPDGGVVPGRLLWVTDEEQEEPDLLFTRLYEERHETGLYPLLLQPADGTPWYASPQQPRPIVELDVEALLRSWWPQDDMPPWPGLAEPSVPSDPDMAAVECAELLSIGLDMAVGLVPASRGADTVALLGWDGPVHQTQATEEISAVLRSWEDRFGARVVMLGGATLHLSVAAPPSTPEHARAVAAEHYAFCHDNIDQNADSFDSYAESLTNATQWEFWWD